MLMDTNAAQFERMGFPWVSGRDQMELGNSPVSKGQRKANARKKPWDPNFVDPKVVVRGLYPEEERAKKHRDNLALIRRHAKAARGEICREMRDPTIRRVELPVVTFKPQRDAELDPFSPAAFAEQSARLARATAAAVADCRRIRADALSAALAKFEAFSID